VYYQEEKKREHVSKALSCSSPTTEQNERMKIETTAAQELKDIRTKNKTKQEEQTTKKK